MKNIRNSLRMARKDLKILFKERGQLAIIFGLPLLLSLAYCGMYASAIGSAKPGGEPKLAIKACIVNEDQGPYGAQVEEVLDTVQVLRLTRSWTADAADEKVAEGEAAAAIIITADFSARLNANQPVRVQLIKDPTNQVEAQTVARILTDGVEVDTSVELLLRLG